MNYSRGTAPAEWPLRPLIFRCDYPREILGEWAVFWEATDRGAYFNLKCRPDDPTEFATNWIAIDVGSVIDLESMQ